MSDTFSTPAEHALSHPELEALQPVAGPSSMGDAAGADLEEAFEVDETVEMILRGGYKTVSRPAYFRYDCIQQLGRELSPLISAGDQIGLQFPDELLPSSVSVFRSIQRRIATSGAQAYVLADSTYGR